MREDRYLQKLCSEKRNTNEGGKRDTEIISKNKKMREERELNVQGVPLTKV